MEWKMEVCIVIFVLYCFYYPRPIRNLCFVRPAPHPVTRTPVS